VAKCIGDNIPCSVDQTMVARWEFCPHLWHKLKQVFALRIKS
jgi:hypothetical protein